MNLVALQFSLPLIYIHFLLSVLLSETSVLDSSFLCDNFWSLTGPWTCRTPGALCLDNLSHGRVGEVAATARRIVGLIRTFCVFGIQRVSHRAFVWDLLGPSLLKHRHCALSLAGFIQSVPSHIAVKNYRTLTHPPIHIFLSPKIFSLS